MQDLEQREELVLTLQDYIVTITFRKKNGDLRVMRCTLNPETIDYVFPEQKLRALAGLPEPWEKDSLAVWDFDASGVNPICCGDWRSFRFDSILSAEFTDRHDRHFRYDVSPWKEIAVRTTY